MNPNTDEIAARTFTALGAEPSPEQQQQQHEQGQAMQAIEEGAAKVIMAIFKIARKLIARQLPEIMEEWPDSMLKEPAQAAVPLLKKHLEKVMQALGANPELAVFCMSMVPLGMGYIAAMERHQKTPPAEVVQAEETTQSSRQEP